MKLFPITLSDVMDTASDKGENEGLREKNRFMRYELIFKSVKGAKYSAIWKINKQKKGGGAGAEREAMKPLPLPLTLLNMWEYFTSLRSGFVNCTLRA